MFMLLCSYYVVMCCSHQRHKTSTRGTFFVCVTFPLCRYVASVNQALLVHTCDWSFLYVIMTMLLCRYVTSVNLSNNNCDVNKNLIYKYNFSFFNSFAIIPICLMFTFSRKPKICSLQVVILQMTAKKCTKLQSDLVAAVHKFAKAASQFCHKINIKFLS